MKSTISFSNHQVKFLQHKIHSIHRNIYLKFFAVQKGYKFYILNN